MRRSVIIAIFAASAVAAISVYAALRDYDTTHIEPVGIYKGEATAVRRQKRKTYTLRVNADLPDPPKGKFYEVWLVKVGGKSSSAGKMKKTGNRYALNYKSDKDLEDYPGVVVTQETSADGLDGRPETHVLEGSFNCP